MLTPRARKQLAALERREQEAINDAIETLADDPRAGDVRKLQGSSTLRKRMGSWRIFFTLLPGERLVIISYIERRGSTTY